MSMIIDIVLDACLDCLKMLPFLLGAFLILEFFEKMSSSRYEIILKRVGAAGPLAGAVLGCIPQCGFSVMAANFYAGGLLSPGTLLAVFIATSDEAILLLLGYPERAGDILWLILIKVIVGVVAGYIVDFFLRSWIEEEKEIHGICSHCGCEKEHGILMPALRHTAQIMLYLFFFNLILGGLIEVFGVESMSAYLLGNTPFQPMIAVLIGLIPNCAASVILSQLYLSGAISFASVVAGLCTGAGIGLVVLFKMNHHKKENLKIMGTLIAVGIITGMVLQIFI